MPPCPICSRPAYSPRQVKLKQRIRVGAEGPNIPILYASNKKIKTTMIKQTYPGIPKHTTLQGELAR